MEEKALISTIQHYSTKDGPGIRSTVFFVGCNLRCRWCANPELMEPGVKYMHFENRCIHCGACVEIAENHAISLADQGCHIDRKKCTNIEACMDICPVDAYEKVGYYITADQLVKKLLRDKVFYEKSGGGVTFSGGESALQETVVTKAAKALRQHGIHVALDTAGHIPWIQLKHMIQEVDMVLYDIKANDFKMHKKCTGIGNDIILDNIKAIASMNKEIIIRMVIVPGWNDDFQDIKKRFEFIRELGSSVKRLDILNYHDLGRGKYHRLGMKYPIQSDKGCTNEFMVRIEEMADKKSLPVYVEY